VSDRFVRSVGAAVVAVGVWAVLLVGATAASAEPQSGNGTTDGSSSPGASSSSTDTTSHTVDAKTQESAGKSKSLDGQPNSGTSYAHSKKEANPSKKDVDAFKEVADAKRDEDNPPASGTAEPPKSDTKPEEAGDTEPTATPPTSSSETESTNEVTATPTPTASPSAATDELTPPTAEIDPAPAVVELPMATDENPKGKRLTDTTSKPGAATDEAAPAEAFGALSAVEESEPEPITPTASNSWIEEAEATVGGDSEASVQAALFSARVATLEAPKPAPVQPSLINVLGSIAFAVLDFVTRLVQGPPAVPPGSSVTVGRSTLQIDCGDGTSVQADWYFATGPVPPTRLIYFQHGFGAVAGMYNYTAATLAERTNSIVVAPSLSSNLFDCQGCSLDGVALQRAVADLFTGDRAALTESARRAFGDDDLVLPQRFVMSGHSEGGSMALGTAGYIAENAEENGTPLDLVGVLLFDSGPQYRGNTVADVIAKLPDDLPVLNIAAEPSFWDVYGQLNTELDALRPGRFNGVQLIGGLHSDAFQTSNPIIQTVVYLLTGFSAPENVAANFDLAEGWVDDMFAGTVYDPINRTGIYGTPGTTIDIPTSTGTDAHEYGLPGPPVHLGLIDSIVNAVVKFIANLDFARCAATDESADASTLGAPQTCSAGRV